MKKKDEEILDVRTVHLLAEYISQSLEKLIKNEQIKFRSELLNFLKNEESLKSKENESELLTRNETAEFLKVDLSTLYHWEKKGLIKVYGIGSRRYYKKSELLENLTQFDKNKIRK